MFPENWLSITSRSACMYVPPLRVVCHCFLYYSLPIEDKNWEV